MYSGLKSIRRERARLERDRVVLESILESNDIIDAFNMADDNIMEETDAEIEELIDRIPESDEDDEEIEKILNADGSLSIDDIMGIDSPVSVDDAVNAI